jgi:prepilin-type N-terminal cleavage/methylation domain-containing protein
MVVHLGKTTERKSRAARDAFSLLEVMVAFAIFGLVMAGMLYGYVEANRIAEWSSQSQAAMSYAMQGMERMRSAQWDAETIPTATGPGTPDVLGTNYSTFEVDTLDVPTSGNPIYATNYITSVQVSGSGPKLRQITSQVVWTFLSTGQAYTNTIVTLRAPDQFQ